MTEPEPSTSDEAREPVPVPTPVHPLLRWFRILLTGALLLAGTPLLVATLLSFTAPLAWWLDLLTHFRPHYAMGLALVAILQLLARPRWLAAAWATAALLNVALIAPLFIAPVPAAAGPALSIMHANVAGDDVDVEALAAWASQTQPDLISLQEITPRNLPRIEQALRSAGLNYQTLTAEPRDDTRGVAMLSRRADVSGAVIVPTLDANRPMVVAQLDLAGAPVAILGFHTTRPAPARPYANQAQGMDGATLWSHAQRLGGAERVLIGDFNSTSQGVLVNNLCRRAGLQDARRGHGIEGTWPSYLPAPLRIPIDGAFHSHGLVTTALEAGPDIGSDHLPLLVTLQARQ